MDGHWGEHMSMYVSASRRPPEQTVTEQTGTERTVTEQTLTEQTATEQATAQAAPERTVAEQPVVAPRQSRFPLGPGWVVHLPIMVPDLDAAVLLAEEMAAWLACVPQIDAGAIEVSAEDEQARRVRVLCQRRISEQLRCWLPRKHEGACYAGQRRPQRRVHNDVARRWADTVDI
jgi:hypothetical protein